MWKEYEVSESNRETYKNLCQKLSKSPSVFKYTFPELQNPIALEYKKKHDPSAPGLNEEKLDLGLPSKKRIKVSSKNPALSKNPEIPVSSDIKTLQKNFANSLNNLKTMNVKLYQSVKPSQVCASDSLVINDEIVILASKKSEKVEDNVAAVIGTLILLPKMCHLSSQLPLSSSDGVCDYVRWHPKISVIHLLVPFLQYCPIIEEHHRELFVKLIEYCSPPLLSHLLSAMASRDVINEVDLRMFHSLCSKSDPKSDEVHTAVLKFLGKASQIHQSSVKLGECLLLVVKQMAQHLKPIDMLQSLIDSHSSSMKKPIQIHLKKILRNH